jgi:hypothetical protein
MRVQASLQFYCKSTGRGLKTKLGTEARNLVVFRPRTLPMRCAFCGQQHYWKLIEYHRPHTKNMKRWPHPTGVTHSPSQQAEG